MTRNKTLPLSALEYIPQVQVFIAGNRSVKYVAELAHVREVSVLGAADLRFWVERLRGEGLTPVEHAGRARVLVVASSSRFFGARFRELSFSVFVRQPDASEGSDAAFLVQAFNSSRFFAWSERTWFSTPYRHGMIDVDVGLPVAMRLGLEGQTVFSALMSRDPRRSPSRSGSEGFAGSIFLPRGTSEKSASGRLFFAKIEGETQAYPFLSTDTLTISPSVDCPILRALIESHFVVDEWLIRCDASHAKSKTFRRMDGQECSAYKSR